MKNRFFCIGLVCLALAACASAPVAKEVRPSYPFEVVKKSGVATFTEKTYDQAWAAIIRTLVASNYKVAVAEKDAGFIEATHIKSDSTRALVGKWQDEPSLSVVVEAKGPDVVVTLTWTRGEKILLRSVSSQQKKIYGEFFQRVADILYQPAKSE